MRQLRTIALVLAALVAAGTAAQTAGPQQQPPPNAALQINWQGVKGAVARYSVPVGALVVWVMSDAEPHTVTHWPDTGEPLFDSGRLQGVGQWFAHRFDRPGQYEVHDKLSPTVSAVIVVR